MCSVRAIRNDGESRPRPHVLDVACTSGYTEMSEMRSEHDHSFVPRDLDAASMTYYSKPAGSRATGQLWEGNTVLCDDRNRCLAKSGATCPLMLLCGAD